MDYHSFLQSTEDKTPPANLAPALEAIWHDIQGNWEAAHSIVQDESDLDSAKVHAYLHRKECDEWNARYWYKRAKCQPFEGSLDEEREALIEEFLSSSPKFGKTKAG